MAATPERASFVEQEFRSATWTSQTVRDWYGKVARDTKDEPYVSFFDSITDAQRYLDERGQLIGGHARRFRTTIDGLLLDDQIDLSQTIPGAQIKDDELVADMVAGVIAIESVDFENERTVLNLWGIIGESPVAIQAANVSSSASGGIFAVGQASVIHGAVLAAAGAGSASAASGTLKPGTAAASGTGGSAIVGQAAVPGAGDVAASGAGAASLTGVKIAASVMSSSGVGALAAGGADANGPTPYRYHRWSFTSATGIVQYYAIRAYDSWGGSDVYQGKTVSASNQSSGAASNAVDGNGSTFWATASTPSPQTFTIDAGVGNTFSSLLFDVLPRTFSANQTAHSTKIEGSADNSTWTTILDVPTLAETVRSEERQFTAGGDDASGYRYLWVKDTGNNFAGAGTAYAKEIRFIGVHSENIALQNIAFVGSVSASGHAVFFGSDEATNGGAAFGVVSGDTLGLDLGRQRLKPGSIIIDHATDSLYAQHGLKQFEVYGSNTNNIATATLLLSVNDTSGTPSAGDSRTYSIP